MDEHVPVVAEPLGPDDRPTADRYRWMVESVQEVIFEADPTGAWTYLNPAWTRILGYDVDECLGQPFLDFVHPDDRQANLDVFLETIGSGKDRCRFDARYLTADGGIRHMEIHAWIFRSPDGTPLGSTGTLTDVTDRRLAEAELERRATTDQLTGLANRATLAVRLASVVSGDDGAAHGTALLFLDLDRFKLVNDSLGHDAGDEVIKAVGDRLRAGVGPNDLVARFGGDEFVVVAPGLDQRGSRRLAGRLRAAIAAPIKLPEHSISVSASVGVRLWMPGEHDELEPIAAAKALLRDADAAMYEAKDAGRDRTELFDLGTRERIVERLETETLLRDAERRGELLVHLQPQVALETDEIVGVEALLRWRHPLLGELAPGGFLEVAEESGLIVPIGRWVLDEACRLLSEVEEARLPRVAINVSARQLTAGLVADVASTLAETGADPRRLCLELTESVLLADTAAARASMAALDDLGIRLSLDDFGTGFSSLAYLQRLPLAELKIDRTFIARLDEPEGRAIVSAVLSMADALGLEVVAEGVEREHQARVLLDMGCTVAQGWWFGRPVDIAHLDDAMAETRRAAGRLHLDERVRTS
jgi:diguanylate cyclase (GGDEF)-like protein/PAS domain S-box-containing protein